MLTSVTLANYRSFGREVTVPLSPISVLVGPNNSGKSVFMTVGQFAKAMLRGYSPWDDPFVAHKPLVGDGLLRFGWRTNTDRFLAEIALPGAAATARPSIWESGGVRVEPTGSWFQPLGHGGSPPHVQMAQRLASALQNSRVVKLSLDKLRADAPVAPGAILGEDGERIAAVVTRWRSFDVEKSERLDEFLRRCVPEVKRVLADATPARQGSQRLWIEQADGTRFDAEHTSDGVLFFVGLAMHVLDAPAGALIFVDEPENSIHPRRQVDLVELLRGAIEETGCQFVLATHSPVLLREFRDEPEAVLLFRRGEEGTEVTPLSEVPRLVEALEESHPGELLADGFFNDPL